LVPPLLELVVNSIGINDRYLSCDACAHPVMGHCHWVGLDGCIIGIFPMRSLLGPLNKGKDDSLSECCTPFVPYISQLYLGEVDEVRRYIPHVQ
jgi:hypothetical protein